MSATPVHRQPVALAAAVVLLHVGCLAALQSGLLVRAYELVVPVEVVSQLIEPPEPETAPPPLPAPPVPSPPALAVPKPITPPPAPQPLAINDPTPAPNAPIATALPPAPLSAMTAPVVVTNAPQAASPAPVPKIELPRSDADYLNNPPPPYPPASRRLGEQGRVIVRVFVSEEGVALRAEVRNSSGFERLDATAVATAMRYRYRPGMRGGVPEAMAVNVPFDFKLD